MREDELIVVILAMVTFVVAVWLVEKIDNWLNQAAKKKNKG